LAECLLPKQNVVGSNPITRSTRTGNGISRWGRSRSDQQSGTVVFPFLGKAEDHEFGHQEAAQGNEQAQVAETAEEGTIPASATVAFLA
jgi:hypothetical protein